MSRGSDDDSLADIEFRQAHLARTVEQLDEVVIEHSRTVSSLERLLRRLEDRVRELEIRLGDEDDSPADSSDGPEAAELPE